MIMNKTFYFKETPCQFELEHQNLDTSEDCVHFHFFQRFPGVTVAVRQRPHSYIEKGRMDYSNISAETEMGQALVSSRG